MRPRIFPAAPVKITLRLITAYVFGFIGVGICWLVLMLV